MRFLHVLTLALLLAACKPAPGGDGADGLSKERFPKPRASYQADYKVYDDDGAAREMTIYASGARYRMESPPEPGQAYRRAAIMDPRAKHVLSFRVGPDQPKVALGMQLETLGRAAVFFRGEDEPLHVRPVGRAFVADVACTIWEIPAEAAGRPASSACLTADGILLRGGDVGAAHPNIEAVRLRRGPLPAGLLAPPPGYEVVDFAPCLALQKEIAAATRAGRRPDPAQVSACEALSAKFEAVMGDQ